MGMRLEGVLNLKTQLIKNIKSEGITKGSIQVPGDGQPIVLFLITQPLEVIQK